MPENEVPVGHVVRAHGVRGAVLVKPLTDDPSLRFRSGETLHASEHGDLVVESVEGHAAGLIIRFTGVTDRTAAETLRGVDLTIERSERRPLEEGEYWPDDLEGCEVRDEAGNLVGVVVGVAFGTAQDRLVVERGDGARAEVPFVAALVPTVDTAARLVVVDLPDDLFD